MHLQKTARESLPCIVTCREVAKREPALKNRGLECGAVCIARESLPHDCQPADEAKTFSLCASIGKRDSPQHKNIGLRRKTGKKHCPIQYGRTTSSVAQPRCCCNSPWCHGLHWSLFLLFFAGETVRQGGVGEPRVELEVKADLVDIPGSLGLGTKASPGPLSRSSVSEPNQFGTMRVKLGCVFNASTHSESSELVPGTGRLADRRAVNLITKHGAINCSTHCFLLLPTSSFLLLLLGLKGPPQEERECGGVERVLQCRQRPCCQRGSF